MTNVRISPGGDPFYAAGRRSGSTRHHRVDHDFLNLLREDFGIDMFSLTQAFFGVPAAPKKQAIAVCEWAEGKTDDPVERGVLVRRWAKKRGRGMYAAEIVGVPELTYEANEREREAGRL